MSAPRKASRGMRFALFAALCVLAAGAFAGIKVLRARSATKAAPAASAGAEKGPSLAELRARPHVFFRSAATGDDFGRVTWPRSRPKARRAHRRR